MISRTRKRARAEGFPGFLLAPSCCASAQGRSSESVATPCAVTADLDALELDAIRPHGFHSPGPSAYCSPQRGQYASAQPLSTNPIHRRHHRRRARIVTILPPTVLIGGQKVFARVNFLQTTSERIADVARVVRDVVHPGIRDETGYVGYVVLGDRESGRALGITLWRSEADRERSDEKARQIRPRVEQATGGTMQSVESYDVLFFDVRQE
jgi:hypothetical protein